MATGRYGTPEAVVLDFSPVTAYLAQQQQIRQAAQQQLDKQINEDLTKLNFDGARTQDYSAIRSGYDAFKNSAIKYKKALKDPKLRDAAEQEYLNSKANLNNIVAQSKEAKERTKSIYEFYAKNRDEINYDEFKSSIAMLNSPIGSPQYEQGRNYDISSVIFKPEQFDANKWQNLVDNIKPREVSSPKTLANGQILTSKKKMYDPIALQQIITQGYNADYGNAKKFYDRQFKTLDPNDKVIYEEYAQKYIPNFVINTAEDLAVASNIYGRIEQDMGSDIKGTDRTRIENFQREMQARIDDRLDKRIAALAKKDEDKNYYVVDSMAKALSEDDGETAIAPILADRSPGVIVRYVSNKSGGKDKGLVDRIYKDLKKDGVDSDTRFLTRKQIGDGVIVVAVPKVNPETKEVVRGQYEYMAVPKNDKFPQPKLNALINYAKGGEIKQLPQKYYKNKLGQDLNSGILSNQAYGPAQLDDADNEEN